MGTQYEHNILTNSVPDDQRVKPILTKTDRTVTNRNVMKQTSNRQTHPLPFQPHPLPPKELQPYATYHTRLTDNRLCLVVRFPCHPACDPTICGTEAGAPVL